MGNSYLAIPFSDVNPGKRFTMKFPQLLALSIALLTAHSTFGSDFHSPRTASLGGAGHAGPLLNDAIYLNPSFISLLPTYSVSVNFEPYSNGTEGYHGHIMNLAIQDGRTELFQAGVAYTVRPDSKIIHVGGSKRLGDPISVGMGAKFVLSDDRVTNLVKDITLSTSVIAMPWLHVVGVLDNVFQSDDGRLRGLYRELTIGTKINLRGIAMVYIDPHYAPSLSTDRAGVEAGAEFTVFKDFFLRGGMFRASTIPYLPGVRGDGWGTGFGWIAPRLSLDYGYSKSTAPTGYFSHHFGATVYF